MNKNEEKSARTKAGLGDAFMVSFGCPLLKRCVRIAVEQVRAPVTAGVEFNSGRMRKFTSVICKDDIEQLPETFRPEAFIKAVEYHRNRPRIIVAAEKSEHVRIQAVDMRQ